MAKALDTYCTSNFAALFAFFIIICGLLLISTIPVLYKYILQKQTLTVQKDDKNTKEYWNIGLVFFVFNILAILFCFILLLKLNIRCTYDTAHQVINSLWITAYFSQSYLLLLIAFMRIKIVFDGTQFALTKCTVVIYRIIFVILPVIEVCNVFTRYATGAAIPLIVISGLLIMTVSVIATIILFVRRLVAVYKTISSQDKLVDTITKLTILNVISLSITVLVPIIMIFITATAPTAFVGTTAFLIGNNVDVYTNFWCVMLSFTHFESYYNRVCGCFHFKCRKCWFKVLGRDARMLAAEQKKKVLSLTTQVSSSAGSAASNSSKPTTDTVQVDITATDLSFAQSANKN